jgi:hypothetical protein
MGFPEGTKIRGLHTSLTRRFSNRRGSPPRHFGQNPGGMLTFFLYPLSFFLYPSLLVFEL